MGNHERKVGLTPADLLEAGFDQVFEDYAIIEADGKLIYMVHEPSKHNPYEFLRNYIFLVIGYQHEDKFLH